jgi:hypothetical protein
VGPLASFAGIAGTPPGVAVVAAITGAGFTLTTEHFVYFAMFAALALISFVVALCFD